MVDGSGLYISIYFINYILNKLHCINLFLFLNAMLLHLLDGLLHLLDGIL